MNKNVLLAAVAVLALVVIGGGVWLMATRKVPNVEATISAELPPTTPKDTQTEDEGELVEATGEIKKFTVEGSGFKFVPNTLKVKQGDTVQITFKNVGGNHDFVIDEFDVKTNVIGDGEEEEVEFVATKTGTFDYYCSVTDHRAKGMLGTLTVE